MGVPASPNPVKAASFLGIDHLKTQTMKTVLIENWLSRLLRADKWRRRVAASVPLLRVKSVGDRYRIGGKSRDVRARARTSELYSYRWLKCPLCSPFSGLVILLSGPCGIAGIESGRLPRLRPVALALRDETHAGETQCDGEETRPYGFIRGSSWREVQIHHLYRLIILPLNTWSLKH